MSTFYDNLGAGYDAIIDWPERLERETPFLREVFSRHDVTSVLDTACGTGEHAALFASWGLEVVGAELSREMLEVCRRKYEGQPIAWAEAGFGETHEKLTRAFDAVTCLGNSFPHVLTDDLAERAAADFAELTKPGGCLIVQQLNYEAMRLAGERVMGPQARTLDGRETLFLRFFELERSPMRFTIVRLTRDGEAWSREEWETEHRAWTAQEMDALLTNAGFRSVEFVGDFSEAPYDPETSDQMILIATQ